MIQGSSSQLSLGEGQRWGLKEAMSLRKWLSFSACSLVRTREDYLTALWASHSAGQATPPSWGFHESRGTCTILLVDCTAFQSVQCPWNSRVMLSKLAAWKDLEGPGKESDTIWCSFLSSISFGSHRNIMFYSKPNTDFLFPCFRERRICRSFKSGCLGQYHGEELIKSNGFNDHISGEAEAESSRSWLLFTC